MRADKARAVLRAAPLLPFEAIAGESPMLVLAPHPDDESLGCGGLIATACARRHEVWVAILTDGGRSHPNSASWPRARLVAERAREVRLATALLGLPADRLLLLGEGDGEAPRAGQRLEELSGRLAALMERHRIGVTFATWRADPHGDHGAAHTIASAACKRTGARHLSYPIWAWMRPDEDDVPDPSGRAMRLDVAAHLPAKRLAIAAHATQHAGLIDDDPNGFALPPAFLAQFDGPTEVFIAERVYSSSDSSSLSS